MWPRLRLTRPSIERARGPMSESKNLVGSESKTSLGIVGKDVAPAALVFTGSKSTNHARKIACASCSSACAVRLVLVNLFVEHSKDSGDGSLFG